MSGTAASKLPWLLYAYPWMPFPRRLAIYLSEKRILDSVVEIVRVLDPQNGNKVHPSQADKYPPRPEGSLPVLAIPPSASDGKWTYISQSMAIIEFLEEATSVPNGPLVHVKARELYRPSDAISRARSRGMLSLAEELTVSWNPVRSFGSKAGFIEFPKGAYEMYRWVHRTLDVVNTTLAESVEEGYDLASLADDETSVSIADIVLYQFLEFTDYCYGVDVTLGSGETKTDVYGRTKKEEYSTLRQWYLAFQKRSSARRDRPGQLAGPEVIALMQTWYPGSLVPVPEPKE